MAIKQTIIIRVWAWTDIQTVRQNELIYTTQNAKDHLWIPMRDRYQYYNIKDRQNIGVCSDVSWMWEVWFTMNCSTSTKKSVPNYIKIHQSIQVPIQSKNSHLLHQISYLWVIVIIILAFMWFLVQITNVVARMRCYTAYSEFIGFGYI